MQKISFPGTDLKCSYHNHSDMSDGASSLEELCRTGKQAGLRELGVSDHWVELPFENSEVYEWCLDPVRLDEYVEKLLRLKKELDDEHFTLRLGLEVDYFPENYREVLKKLSDYPLDYLIGSVHYSGTFSVDHAKEDWLVLTQEQKDEISELYWQKVEGAAQCSEFLFLGHLDLPKKYALIDSGKYLPHARRVLDLVHQNGGAIELNTAGWFKDCREQYPALEILRIACGLKIPVVVSADSHAAAHLTQNFAQAAEILHQAGYPIS